MLKFRNGLLCGTTMSASGAADHGPGGGGGGAGNAAFLATLPEPLRGHEAFKDVGDVNTLAQRYADTRKPFAEQLPADIRNEAYFKDVKDLDGLAKRAISQAKMIGLDKSQLAVLPKGADDKDGWNALYGQLGRPQAADKYVVPKRADNKDYSPEEAAFQKTILPVLHDAGLSQRQFDAIVPAWNKIVDAQNKSQTDLWDTNANKANEALRTEYGAAYDQKVASAQRTIDELGSPELKEELSRASRDGKTLLGDSPHLTRMLAAIAEKFLKEDNLEGKGEGQGGGQILSPAEANQQINALKADTDFVKAWTKKDHPGHADAVAKMMRLQGFANPGP